MKHTFRFLLSPAIQLAALGLVIVAGLSAPSLTHALFFNAQLLPDPMVPISDLRIENGELKWTAPGNVSRYYVRFYTGETMNTSASFSGCGFDQYQHDNLNGNQYCAGEAASVTWRPGATERLTLWQQPPKSYVVFYEDSNGRKSGQSNIAVHRAEALPPIMDLRIEDGELKWTAPLNVSRYGVQYYTGETTSRSSSFRGCSQGGVDYMTRFDGRVSYCGWEPVSITKRPGALERLRDASSAPASTQSFVVYYYDATGRRSEVSNVAVQRGEPLRSISDLRAENGFLKWTAPASVDRYYITFYTGETTNTNMGFYGCSGDVPQIQNPNGELYCAGSAMSITRRPGATESLRIGQTPPKSYVVKYSDTSGRLSGISNVAVHRDEPIRPISDLRIEDGELRWTAPVNVQTYNIRFYTGETTDPNRGFGGCGAEINPSNPRETRYCSVQEVSVTLRPGATERVRISQNPPKSYIIQYSNTSGQRSGVSNVVVHRSVSQESLQLWGPTRERFYLLPVGQDILLTGASADLNPVLTNFKTDQLDCRSVPVTYGGSDNNNAKWLCTALRTGNSNSEVYFTIGNQRSDTIVIQVTSTPYSSSRRSSSSQPSERFTARAENITANSVTLSTLRRPAANEYYGASCSPYTGMEDSAGFTQASRVIVRNLQANTNYICRIYIYPSEQGGNTQGASVDVALRTLSASSRRSRSSAPPAGFEDEVITDDATNPFSDTDMNTLEGKAAAELYRRGVIGGFPDGEFKGDRPVNRAEAAKFLLLATGTQVGEASNSRFPDVPNGQWYTKYVIAAAKLGIILGNLDGTFRPANGVNTAEFLAMLTRAFGLEQNLPENYSDVSAGDWFFPFAGIAQKYDLFPGRSPLLYPGRALTRNEVAVAIYQYLLNR